MSPQLQQLLGTLGHLSDSDRDLITRAHDFAARAHEGHERESGEPYFNHLVATAENLVSMGAGATTIAAGLLHDTLEDTKTTSEDLKNAFGEEILFLVESVTKLGKLKYRGLKRHVETLRKLFVATAEDERVILIKLADRLHNLRSIDALPREKQERIATETLEIYAPIAHRLGIGTIKGEIEDTCFKILLPKEYEETQRLRDLKRNETEEELTRFTTQLSDALNKARIDVHTIDRRMKHLYSLYRKLKNKSHNIDEIHDIAAVRVIVPTLEACYLALGIIHSIWTPLPGRIKDYIAMPKPNGYQSLHTTIFTGEGATVEIQIRTSAMHAVAEQGVASHALYKETKSSASEIDELRDLLDMPKRHAHKHKEWFARIAEHGTDDEEDTYIKELKTDFFNRRVLVFTPKGEVVDLPEDATPIDFAYAIHTDLGDKAVGARVNGKFVALSTTLHHGDIVLIETNSSGKPSAKWLEIAKTSSARKKIRSALGMARGSTPKSS